MLQKRCMHILPVILIALIFCSAEALHFSRMIHTSITTSDLTLIVNSAIKNLTDLNTSVNTTVSSLNPFNQEDRIQKLQWLIGQSKQSLFNIYIQSAIPLNSSTYYCQQIPPDQLITIKTALDAIGQGINSMTQTVPLNDPNHPSQQTSQQISSVMNSIRDTLQQSGIVTAGAPIQVQQTNLASSNWTAGSTGLATLSNSYTVGNFQNGKTCPVDKPFTNIKNECVNCSGYFDLTSKACTPCTNFDKTKQVCVDPPIQRLTNLQNPNGLLLPSSKTLADYQTQLNAKGPNLATCPLSTPYFNGTDCIACGSGQLFSVQINTCQTCPSGSIYSSTTYHCQTIVYYTNLDASSNWLSVQKTPANIQTQISQKAVVPNAQKCVDTIPFFDGTKCISCQSPTPYFSFDSNSCANCVGGTIFSNNLHSCVTTHKSQTNMNAPNLLLEGHSFNEWKSEYVNNQMADPTLGDCPSAKPYFDGLTCVACYPPKSLFSMTTKVCTSCAPGTKYDTSARQCLSSSGNIVTQSPTLAKMAAGIFAG